MKPDPSFDSRTAHQTDAILFSGPAQEDGPGDRVIAYDTCLMENYVAASAADADAFECIDVGASQPVMFLLNDQGSEVNVVLVPPDPQSRTGYGSAILKETLSEPVAATASAWSVVGGHAAFLMLVGPAKEGPYDLYVSFRTDLVQGDKLTDAPVTEADRWGAVTKVSGITVPAGQTPTGFAAGYDESGALWVGVTGSGTGLLLYLALPGDPPTQWQTAGGYQQIQGTYGNQPISLPTAPGVMVGLSAVSHCGKVVFATKSLCLMGDEMRLALGVVSCVYDAQTKKSTTDDWIALNGDSLYVLREPLGLQANNEFPFTLYIDEDGGLCAACFTYSMVCGGTTLENPIMEVLLYDSQGTAITSEDDSQWRARFLARLPLDLKGDSNHYTEELGALMSQEGVATVLLLANLENGKGQNEWICYGAQTTGTLQAYTGGSLGSPPDSVLLIPAAPKNRTPSEIEAVPMGLIAEDAPFRGTGRGGCCPAPMFMSLAPNTTAPLASLTFDPSTTDWLTSVVAFDSSGIDFDTPARRVVTWSVQLTGLDEKGRPTIRTWEGVKELGSGDSTSLLQIRAWEMVDVQINGVAATLPPNEWVPVPVTGTMATITIPTLALSGPTLEVCTTDGRVSPDDPVVIYCSSSVGNRLGETEAGDLETPRDRYGAPMLDVEGNPEPILPSQTNSPENCAAVASALQGCGEIGEGSHRDVTGWGRRMDRSVQPPASLTGRDTLLCAAALRADRERPVCFHLRFDRSGNTGADGTAVRVSYRDLNVAEATDLLAELRASHGPLDVERLRHRMGPARSKPFKRIKRGWGDVTRAVTEEFVELEEIAVMAVDGTVKVVMTLADAVEGAATFLYETTLSLVEQVMDVAQMIFTAVEVAFEKLVTWLAWIFAWDDIERSAVAVQLILGDTWGGLLASEEAVAKEINVFLHEKQDDFNAYCDEFKAGGPDGTGLGAKTFGELLGIRDSHDVRPPVQDSAETGGHNIVLNSFTSDPNATDFTGDTEIPLQLDPDEADIQAEQEAAEDLNEQITELSPEAKESYGGYVKKFHEDPRGEILETTVGDLVNPMQQLVNDGFETIEDAVELVFGQASSSAQVFAAVAVSPIQVPLLTQILKLLGWKTGISPLELTSLAIAVPFTATYKILCGKAPFPDDDAIEKFASWLAAEATMKAVARGEGPSGFLFTPAGREEPVQLTANDCADWVGHALLDGIPRLRPDCEPIRVSTRAGQHGQIYDLEYKRTVLIARTSVGVVSFAIGGILSTLSLASREASLPRAFYTVPPSVPPFYAIAPNGKILGGGPGRKSKTVRSLNELIEGLQIGSAQAQGLLYGSENLGGRYGTPSEGETFDAAPEELRDSWIMLAKWMSILLELTSVGLHNPKIDTPSGSKPGPKVWRAWAAEMSCVVLPDVGSMVIYDKKVASVLPEGPWIGSALGSIALGCGIYRCVETLSWDHHDSDPLQTANNTIFLGTWAGNLLNKFQHVFSFLNAPKLWLMMEIPLGDSGNFTLFPAGVASYASGSIISSFLGIVADGVMIVAQDDVISYTKKHPPASSMWALGGIGDDSVHLATTEYLLEPNASEWNQGSGPLKNFTAATAASLAGSLYVVGGSEQGVAQTTVQTLTPPRRASQPMPAWTNTVIPALPVGVIGAAAVGVGGTKLVVAGGLAGEYLFSTASVYIYDLEDTGKGWQEGPELATPRAYFGLAVVPDSSGEPGWLYAVGGWENTEDTGAVLSSVEVLDLTKLHDGWQPGPALAAPRKRHSLSGVGETLVVAGGLDGQGNSLESVEILVTNATPPTWTQTQPLPEPRYNQGAAVLGSTVYIVGGTVGDPPAPTASCLAADLQAEHTEWREQPSMSDARALPGVARGFPGSWG